MAIIAKRIGVATAIFIISSRLRAQHNRGSYTGAHANQITDSIFTDIVIVAATFFTAAGGGACHRASRNQFYRTRKDNILGNTTNICCSGQPQKFTDHPAMGEVAATDIAAA